MDPISIASTVAQTTGTCLSIIKSLYDLREKYKDAPMVIAAICSESTVISASLAQVQSLLLQRQDLARVLASQTELSAVLDQALTGCMLIFSCLDAEIQRITGGTENGALRRWRPRLRMMWNESQLKDLLGSIRGQQTAMTLLIQLLQMNTLHEINDTLQQKGDAFRKSASMTQSLRVRNPSVRVARSIYDRGTRMGAAGAPPDSASMVAPSELEFDFDDLVINSRAYRKVVHAWIKTRPSAIQEAPLGDLIELNDTTAEQRDMAPAPPPAALQDLQSLTIPRAETMAGGDLADQGLQEATAVDEAANEHGVVWRPGWSGTLKRCSKCNFGLAGHGLRVPATGGEKLFHAGCFTCTDCANQLEEFLEVDGAFLCERDDFRRRLLRGMDCFRPMDLLCNTCGGVLKGEYVAAAHRKFHVDHLRCEEPGCGRVLGNQDRYYYEHGGKAYCGRHGFKVSQQNAPFDSPTCKRRIEFRRLNATEFWRVECHELSKSWNARMKTINDVQETQRTNMLGTPFEPGRVFELVTAFREAIAVQLSEIRIALIYTESFTKFLRAVRAMIGCIGRSL